MAMQTRLSLSSPALVLALSCAAFGGYACSDGPHGFLHAMPGTSEADGGNGTSGGGATAGGGSGGSAEGGTTAGSDGGAAPTAQATPASLRVRRLTIEEYTNTVKDLLATQTNYGTVLPADPVTNGFDDDSDTLEVNPLFADEARINAEAIAATFNMSTLGCTPQSGSAGDSCAQSFLKSFGQRALRRPLTGGEITAYTTLFETVSSASDGPSGIRAILEAMLQSPSFLYRTELGNAADAGGTITLTPWEIASELSYLFWRTMPDAELVSHAQSGDIVQPSVVAQEVTRLLADPRANAMLDAFADQWLETNLLPLAQKDANTFPTYTSSVQSDLGGEIHAFFEASARDPKGSLASMLTAPYSYLNANLAQFYGVTGGTGSGPSVNGFTQTTLPAGRGGLLTLGAILAIQATPLAGNPVRRGKLVRTQLFCQPIPPPPPGVAGPIPALDPNTANKQAWQQHSTDPSCSPCHDRLDPIGFGFDQFDAIGRLLPGTIDSSGEITSTATTDGTFNGPLDLAQKLAASADVEACFVKQWVRFGLGVGDTTASGAEVTRIVGTFGSTGAGVQGVLKALTQAPYFYARQATP
jgi:hypothetical protein